MILFEKKILDNGLTVIVHEDPATPMAAVNILYKVGARNEEAGKTGFAHLFEHLMFGGSLNVPNFDTQLQYAGGTNNAFTNNDITNYYDVLPAANLETAFWLESDRMLQLDFNEHSLEVQRKVVCEEFKENYLNQPYGDIWHIIRSMAYKNHPYKWPTIGLELSHIENAVMDDVRDFFYRFYRPDNAILVVAGGVRHEEVFGLAEKWFGDIPSSGLSRQIVSEEPEQHDARFREVRADVPVNVLFKAYQMCRRTDPQYYAMDTISDILSTGDSSRLYVNLVKNQEIFSDIEAYVMGSLDKGLFIVEGKISEGISIEEADRAVQDELQKLVADVVSDDEYIKIRNQIESYHVFSNTKVLNKAMNLAFMELLGDAGMINKEVEAYNAVTKDDIRSLAAKVFRKDNCSTLYYLSN